MPIVWKVAFEEPLIKLIESGAVGNSKRLVDAISLQYDIAIRQGLPNPPGTPAGPLINGNIIAFRRALNTFYFIESSKQRILLIGIYSKLIKEIFKQIKETYKDISKRRTQLKQLIREQTKNLRDIKQLRRLVTIEARKRVVNLLLKNAKLLALKNDILRFIQEKKDFILNEIRPKIDALRTKLQNFLKKLAFPFLQETKLALIKKLPRLIKNVVKEIKEKKKQYLDLIKSNIKKINDLSKQFKKLVKSLNKEDVKRITSAIKTLIRSASIGSVSRAADLISSILAKYPDSKISMKLKSICRSNVAKILKLKIDIANIKEFAKEFLQTLLIERRELLSKVFSKFGKIVSRVQELRNRAKELKSFLSQYRNLLPSLKQIRQILVVLRKEIRTINRKKIGKYLPKKVLGDLLNKLRFGLGSKYLEIDSIEDAKRYLGAALITVLSSNAFLTELKDKYKNQILEIRDKIKRQLVNPKEILFNSYLRLAVTGYWTGGVMPNLGIVTFPGAVTLPVSLKASSNSANFIRSLSRTLQLHTKTVAGTYTIPGTPPVVLPWVGYS